MLSQNRVDDAQIFQACAIRPSGTIGVGDLVELPGIVEAYYRGQTKFQLGSDRNLFDFANNTNAAYAHCLAAVKLHEQPKMTQLPEQTLESTERS